MASKIHELNKHLQDHDVQVFGLVETFCTNDSRPPSLDANYVWVGKRRNNTKDKGGIGLCIKSGLPILDDNLLNSRLDAFERLWILTRINYIKTAIGIVYFPNDGVHKQITDELMFQLLDDTSQINALGYEIALLGDFNGRCVNVCEHTHKNIMSDVLSYNGKRLSQFIDASELILANTLDCCDGHYTRILNNQRSAIDYVLLSNNLAKNVSRVFIDDIGQFDLHSDHVIIRVDILSKLITKQYSNSNNVRWMINDNTDWSSFQNELTVNLSSFAQFVNENKDVNLIWNHWKSIIENAAISSIGKAKPVKNYRNFWDKELDNLLKQRRDANRLKRIHDKSHPHNDVVGERLTNQYKSRKSKLQEAVKRKNHSAKVKDFTRKCSNSKNKIKGFWNFLKLKQNNETPSELTDPNDPDKKLTEHSDINMALGNHFSSIGCMNNKNDALVGKVNTLVSKIDNNMIYPTSPLNLKIDGKMISDILNKLKSGKACGIDNIPNEFLKYGGNSLSNSLTKFFTKITDLEIIPDEWFKGIIKPLHKGGSIHNLSNYRGITLTSNVYKVYCKIIESTVMDFIESNNLLGEAQGAFRKDRRAEDHVFSLQGMCSLRKSNKEKTYLAFLDLSAAFDKVWRDGLFYLLWQNGIQGKCWKILRALYKNVSNKVLFGGYESDWFDQEFGLKQGCILYPTLFSILMTDLVSMLKEKGLGMNLAGELINCLLFADDIVLIGKSEKELQSLLDIASAFVTKWNLKFNVSKSKVLVVGKKK